MQTVCTKMVRYCTGCRRQCLAQDLAAEYGTVSQILALAPEDLFLNFFQAEQSQEFCKYLLSNAIRHNIHLYS
ncbi:MAG: hypothetical protein MI799_16180 [Desulfobacterales bacterium]|nr:hypothetical protein [Desulfobacterales bacterium]